MSDKGPSILVLSASTGNGHVSAAEAIVAEAKSRGLRAEHIDVLDHVSKGFRAWYRGGYEVLVRKRPKAWGTLYRTSDRPRFNYHFQTNLDKQFCKRLEKVVKERQPDWIVCTHSLPQPALDRIRRVGNFKVAVVVTDLYVHRMWLRGRVDRYFVPQQWSKEVLERRLPHFKGEIVVTGIPINRLFSEQGAKEDCRARMAKELGMPSGAEVEKWALVSSGGIGGGPLVEVAKLMSKSDFRTVVVAGRNERTRALLEEQMAGCNNVTVLGAVSQKQMAQLMGASEFLVAKPGGLTTFEALASGLPFVVFWPFLIPGQEEGNAEFLAETGAGVIAKDLGELEAVLKSFESDPGKLRVMAVAAHEQAQPKATQLIVENLESQP